MDESLLPSDKREKFRRVLEKSMTEDAEDRLVRAMLILEMELGVFIDEHYPLLKMFEQLEEYSRYSEEMERKYKTMGV